MSIQLLVHLHRPEHLCGIFEHLSASFHHLVSDIRRHLNGHIDRNLDGFLALSLLSSGHFSRLSFVWDTGFVSLAKIEIFIRLTFVFFALFLSAVTIVEGAGQTALGSGKSNPRAIYPSSHQFDGTPGLVDLGQEVWGFLLGSRNFLLGRIESMNSFL